MDFNILDTKKRELEEKIITLHDITIENLEKAFELEYTHNSTAIEGNTLTLIQTKAVLEDHLSIGGKDLREIYEVVNHQKAYNYIKRCIKEGKELNEDIIKDIHEILMDNIIHGGIYRNQEVRISGAGHTPPSGQNMMDQLRFFYEDLTIKIKEIHPIELAVWTHAEFVRIHPFLDGNGRTSRLLMNYQLLANGFLPVSIKKENRLEYYEALEEYATEDNLDIFTNMIIVEENERLDQYLDIKIV